MKIIKTTLLNTLVGVYAIAGGLAFLLIQTAKLFQPEKAKADMITHPLGLFEWGFVWADTVVPAPFLLIGGIMMLFHQQTLRRIGGLLVFSGFVVNLYAMIVLWIGFWRIGHPMTTGLFWANFLLTLLGVFGMVIIAGKIDRKEE